MMVVGAKEIEGIGVRVGPGVGAEETEGRPVGLAVGTRVGVEVTVGDDVGSQ